MKNRMVEFSSRPVLFLLCCLEAVQSGANTVFSLGLKNGGDDGKNKSPSLTVVVL